MKRLVSHTNEFIAGLCAINSLFSIALIKIQTENWVVYAGKSENIPLPKNWIIAAIIGILISVVTLILVLPKRPKIHTNPAIMGISLQDYLNGLTKPLTAREVVSLMMPLAIELRDLHNNGNVLLNVCPKTLSVTGTGVKMDPLWSTSHIEEEFAAPEQKDGGRMGITTDVYSFCAVMDHMLKASTQSAPFPPLPINSGLPTMPPSVPVQPAGMPPVIADPDLPALQSINAKGMETDSKLRFGSFQELILEMAGLNQPIAAYLLAPLANSPQNPLPVAKKSPAKLAVGLSISGLIMILILIQGILIGSLRHAMRDGDYESAHRTLSMVIAPNLLIPDEDKYISAGWSLEKGKYDDAYENFTSLGNYFNSKEMSQESYYQKAADLVDRGEYEEAILTYRQIIDYEDSYELLQSARYQYGEQLIEDGNYEEALSCFSILAQIDYEDADEMILATYYEWGKSLVEDGDYYTAYEKLSLAKGYKDTEVLLDSVELMVYLEGVQFYENADYSNSLKFFSIIREYQDSNIYIILSNAHLGTLLTQAMVDTLKPMIYLEDVGDVLVMNNNNAQIFLMGTWSGSGYYFTMKEDGNTTYNLPWYDGDYYTIEDGIFYTYYEGYESQKTALFKFDVISEDMMFVYVYKNGHTYVLYR